MAVVAAKRKQAAAVIVLFVFVRGGRVEKEEKENLGERLVRSKGGDRVL